MDLFYREKNLATIAPKLHLLQLESLKRKKISTFRVLSSSIPGKSSSLAAVRCLSLDKPTVKRKEGTGV